MHLQRARKLANLAVQKSKLVCGRGPTRVYMPGSLLERHACKHSACHACCAIASLSVRTFSAITRVCTRARRIGARVSVRCERVHVRVQVPSAPFRRLCVRHHWFICCVAPARGCAFEWVRKRALASCDNVDLVVAASLVARANQRLTERGITRSAHFQVKQCRPRPSPRSTCACTPVLQHARAFQPKLRVWRAHEVSESRPPGM